LAIGLKLVRVRAGAKPDFAAPRRSEHVSPARSAALARDAPYFIITAQHIVLMSICLQMMKSPDVRAHRLTTASQHRNHLSIQ
jgi:hypothetical protein